jgi:hypothetical protein
MPFTGTFHQKIRLGRYATGPGGGLSSHCAADIRSEGIEWLWHGRMARGRMARGKHTCIVADAAGGGSRTAKGQGHGVPAGGPVSAVEVNRMAREHGLTPKTVRSALEALKVKITRDGFGPGSKSLWFLRRPS